MDNRACLRRQLTTSGLARDGDRGWNFSGFKLHLLSLFPSVAPIAASLCLSSLCLLPGWDAVLAFKLCLSLKVFCSGLFAWFFTYDFLNLPFTPTEGQKKKTKEKKIYISPHWV